MGFVKIDDAIQVNDMNEQLKNDIFNFCCELLFKSNRAGFGYTDNKKENERNLEDIWINHFHESIGTVPTVYGDINETLFHTYRQLAFYNIYDFLEYVLANYSTGVKTYSDANKVLEKNHSGYRFIKKLLQPIASKTDIKNIKSGLKSKLDGGHLQNALNELGKRTGINLNTVMKESIDAVETATHHIATELFNGQPKDTMGRSITILKDNGFIENHPAYLEAFSKLYGYSSDGGIRHPKDRDYKVDQAEATFMLEICSAFISMLKFKFSEYQNK